MIARGMDERAWRAAVIGGALLCALSTGCGGETGETPAGGPSDMDRADQGGGDLGAPDQGAPSEEMGADDQGSTTPTDMALEDEGTSPSDLGQEEDQSSSPDDMSLDMSGGGEDMPGVDPPQSGCGKAPGASDRKWTVQHDGRTREFHVRLPDGYDVNTPTPLLFDFHGRTMNAAAERSLSSLHTKGAAAGFIVVHPEGLQQTWNAGSYCCGYASTNQIDDVGFTLAMIEQLEQSLCVDSAAIFSAGMSNGGYFSHRLACRLADKFAAIAPVAGTLVEPGCAPSKPVGVFHFHGTSDNLVPYDGYDRVTKSDSVETTLSTWIALNGCDEQGSVFFDEDDVTCTVWTGCAQGREVRHCKVDGGGHTWPGGAGLPFLGRTTQTISASDMMLDFFLTQRRP